MIDATKSYLTEADVFDDVPKIQGRDNDEKPICSIIIPCYNYGSFLRDAVESATNQTLPIEVIIVDDGSTDDETKNIIFSYAGKPGVNVIFKANAGLAEARNTGIRAAEGTYICCLDADDVLASCYIEQCIYELESHENAGFVYSWVRLFGDENYVWETKNFSIDEALKDNLTSVGAVYRKADWELIGGYDARMSDGYEDWEFWLRLAQLGRSGRVIEESLFYHRRHGTTMTHTALELRSKLMERMRELNARLFSDDEWLGLVRKYSSCTKDGIHPSAHVADVKEKLDSGTKSILCILPWLKPGGAEILMLDILSGLACDFNIIVVTTLNDEHLLRSKYEEITNQIFHFPDSRRNEEFEKFIRYLAETRNAVVAITSGSKRLYDTIQNIKENHPKLPVIDVLHNDSDIGYSKKAISKTAYIDKHVCVSGKIQASMVASGIPGEKAIAIPNGVDVLNQFSPGVNRTALRRKELGVPSNAIVVGFVGRASEEKRPLLYLELMRRLRLKKNIHGVCVTDGPLYDKVLTCIDEYELSESVVVIKAVDHDTMSGIYDACDLIVNVSSVEGMPLTVLESLATGCPVAAMSVGEIDRVLIDGKNGILVPFDDFDRLTEKCIELLSSPDKLEACRANARKSVIDRGYDHLSMISSYRDLINDFL